MKITKVILILHVLLSLSFVLASCGVYNSNQVDTPEIQGSLNNANATDELIPESESAEPTNGGTKILVAYFSCTGNTKTLA